MADPHTPPVDPAIEPLARRLFTDAALPFHWDSLSEENRDGFRDRAIFYLARIDDWRTSQGYVRPQRATGPKDDTP